MFQSLDIFETAISMARHAGQMQANSARNIANADTPGYRARDMADFREYLREQHGALRQTRSGHLTLHSASGPAAQDRLSVSDPNGNTVSVETEMVHAVNAKRQHDRALAIYRSGLSILRASVNTR